MPYGMGESKKKDAVWRQKEARIILFRFNAVAERRQWSSAASIPRRKSLAKLFPHFCAANVPSLQICRLRSALWYSGVFNLHFPQSSRQSRHSFHVISAVKGFYEGPGAILALSHLEEGEGVGSRVTEQ